jgi:ATPase subunit of ABC transporter with duplicated ATPase domains
MACVRAEGLAFAYSDRAPILDRGSFHLAPGWHGLVGANGAGKTTLARLIAGELAPTEGCIRLEPPEATVVICEQQVERLTPKLERFAAADDRASRRQQGFFALDRDALARWSTLSPGERKRWQLAAALAESPDVLVVDEPTNHLDGEARGLILQDLASFAGVGIVISHDRALLDALTSTTLRIHQGRLEHFPASYGQARLLWESAAERAAAERSRRVELTSAFQQRMAEARRDAHAAHQRRSAGSRMRNRHDHDARSIAAGIRAEHGETRVGRRVALVAAELERLRGSIPEFVVDKTLGRSVFVGYEPAPTAHLLRLAGQSIRAGARLLLSDVRVVLGREDRVHLTGPNGAGKSTLVKALLEVAGPNRGRLLYLPQELVQEEVSALRRSVSERPPSERGRILSLLAALGSDPERLLASQTLSPGEARKLKMALGLAVHAWALVLDEPTNHLDLPSIERLEAALRAFPGALLIVSHDERFAQAVTTTTWRIQGSQLEV